MGNDERTPGDKPNGQTPGLPDSGQSWESLFSEAVIQHQQGIQGDKQAVKKAYELLDQIRKMVPGNNLVQAYYGSATALRGRDSRDTSLRFRRAIKGLKMLDESVSKEPDNVEIRILRAYVSFKLPEMYFHRSATAVEDFSYLASRFEQDSSIFPQELYWKILFDLGSAYKKLEKYREAQSVWKKLLKHTTDAKYEELVKQEEMDLPDSSDSRNKYRSKGKKSWKDEAKDLPRKGLQLYEQALAGDREAARKAFQVFAKAYEMEPGNQLLRAYYADTLSMQGQFENDVPEKIHYAIKGMQEFDSAVNANPDHVQVRYMRAYHSLRLPESFFHRTHTAIGDIEYLIERYEQDSSILPQETYWQLLYDLGVAYQRMGMDKECEAAWKKLRSLAPDPKYKRMIRANSRRSFRSAQEIPVENKEELYKEGKRLHQLAVSGSIQASRAAMELWQKAREAYPEDPLAEAYYGSSMALAARDSAEPSAIFANTFRSLKTLDRAVSRDENNAEIRLLRAYLLYSLPGEFFPFADRAIPDFLKLIEAYERDRDVFSEERYHQILFDMGMAYERAGEKHRAQKVWRKLLKKRPDPKYQELLKERV